MQRSLRDVAGLYNCGASLPEVEAHRRSSGLQSIGSKCFASANICALLIDDGIVFDKMHDWEWHSRLVPAVGRILRIERLAETILNEVRNFTTLLQSLFFSCIYLYISHKVLHINELHSI